MEPVLGQQVQVLNNTGGALLGLDNEAAEEALRHRRIAQERPRQGVARPSAREMGRADGSALTNCSLILLFFAVLAGRQFLIPPQLAPR